MGPWTTAGGDPLTVSFDDLRARGFRLLDHPGVRTWARREATDWVRYVLEGGRTLHQAAEADPRAREMAGRGPVYVIPAKLPAEERHSSGGEWAVRHYVRGGRVVSRLLGDRYLKVGDRRPFQELRVNETARDRGVPTARVMAAALYPDRLFYRGDLVTEMVPGSSDLVEALFDPRRKGMGGAVERRDALRAAGQLIRKLSASGLSHQDLHAGNVLLRWSGAAPDPFLVDLDRCRVGEEGASGDARAMLRRLERSLRKWEKIAGLALSRAEWATLEETALG